MEELYKKLIEGKFEVKDKSYYYLQGLTYPEDGELYHAIVRKKEVNDGDVIASIRTLSKTRAVQFAQKYVDITPS